MTKHFHTYKYTRTHSAAAPGLRQDRQAVKTAVQIEDDSLLEAIKGDKEHLARHMLLENQFSDLELQDKKNDGTSLFWATAKGLEDIVELLIWNGAYVASRAKTGCTPLHAACDAGHLSIARLLLKWGAPLDAVNKNGDSSLHMASRRGHLAVVLLLLEKETYHVNTENYNGKTPLQVAAANEQDHIVNVLKEHGRREKFPNETKDDLVVRRTRSRDASRKRRTWIPETDSETTRTRQQQSEPSRTRRDPSRKSRKSTEPTLFPELVLPDLRKKRDNTRKSSTTVNPLVKIKDDKCDDTHATRTTTNTHAQELTGYKCKGTDKSPEEKFMKNSKHLYEGHWEQFSDRNPSTAVPMPKPATKPTTTTTNAPNSVTSPTTDLSYSVFNGYLNSNPCSMCANNHGDFKHKRMSSLRLQSLPFGFSEETNDLNKK